ncbi:MAG: hydrogenase maturation nickel metallochaperone HypA [Candidatus Methanofastidiosa archaeon]|nr:hydrogenase maturation nickel metallochaperone HypA [Candidatus Methanofastidiosa archaeon]
MHEVTVAQSAVNIALEESKKQSAKRILLIELDIGNLSLISLEQLTFWITELLRGTIGEGTEIKINLKEGKIKCKECGSESPVELEDDPYYHFSVPRFDCPKCGSPNTFIFEGREMYVKTIRVEK